MTTLIKAISVRQPWAWLIAHGFQDMENRPWPTKHRGDTLVHAGQVFDAEGLAWVRRTLPSIAARMPASFELGGVVGLVQVLGCVQQHSSMWFKGPYGFVLWGARALPLVRMPGELGFFDVRMNDELHAAITSPNAAHLEAAGQNRLFE